MVQRNNNDTRPVPQRKSALKARDLIRAVAADELQDGTPVKRTPSRVTETVERVPDAPQADRRRKLDNAQRREPVRRRLLFDDNANDEEVHDDDESESFDEDTVEFLPLRDEWTGNQWNYVWHRFGVAAASYTFLFTLALLFDRCENLSSAPLTHWFYNYNVWELPLLFHLSAFACLYFYHQWPSVHYAVTALVAYKQITCQLQHQ